MTTDVMGDRTQSVEGLPVLTYAFREADAASDRRAQDLRRDMIAIHGGANTQPTSIIGISDDSTAAPHHFHPFDFRDIFTPHAGTGCVYDTGEFIQTFQGSFDVEGSQRDVEHYDEWVSANIAVPVEAARTSHGPTVGPLDDQSFGHVYGRYIGGNSLGTSYIILDFSNLQDSRPQRLFSWRFKWLESRLDDAFVAAGEERFEVGMDSRFSQQLDELCLVNSDFVLQSLVRRMTASSCDPQVIVEVLEWAARQRKPLDQGVSELFKDGLSHSSPLVRDTAALSFAEFDEEEALMYLRRALQIEKVSELRTDLEALIQSLES